MPLGALMPPPLTMMMMLLVVVVVPLRATVSPVSSLDVRGTALCHGSCSGCCRSSLDWADRDTDAVAVLICSIQCRAEEPGESADTETGAAIEPEAGSPLGRGAYSLLLPTARNVGQSGRLFPDERKAEAPATGDLGAVVFEDAEANGGSSTRVAGFWEPGSDDLRLKRYGGFMERMRDGRLILPLSAASPPGQQQQQRSLRKRYGGFMRRVGRPWPELDEGPKMNDGFMRRLFGVSIRSDGDGQPRDDARPPAPGAA